MGADEGTRQEWIGHSETARDRIGLEKCRALQATLDTGGPPLGEGDPLPPLWHWLYFWTIAPRSILGRDGHPELGGFLPPLGVARRMWAGSRVAFPGTLRIGDEAERRSTITDVTTKQGRSGRLDFVTARHEITGPDGVAIVDEHDIVYREGLGGEAGIPPGQPAPDGAAIRVEFVTDPTLLFRYSALTFNGHRIHYDRDYVTGVEGYPGLVVHGPLLATLLVGLAARARPDAALARFDFRAVRPVFDGEPFALCGSPAGKSAMKLWVADAGGQLAMRANAGFRDPG